MVKKIKITHDGQPCRKCGVPVVKRFHDKPFEPKGKYWFKYWFVCPGCKTVYIDFSAKILTSEFDKRHSKKMKREKERKGFPRKRYINYYQYINSQEWREKSDEAKKRAGYKCQICNHSYSETILDTHHRTYERLGQEESQDLIVLCRECHQIFHNNKRLAYPVNRQTIS